MVVHPAPPADVPSLVDAYREVLGSFVSTCDGLREAEWELPTACPGWSVRDHLAHVAHVEDYLSGSRHPVAERGASATEVAQISVGSPKHVHHDFSVWLEEGVRARAHRAPGELLTELRGIIEVRIAQMYDPDLAMETLVRSVRDEEMPFGRLLGLRLIDVWVHEQDVRATVDRPGSLDTPGASQFVSTILDTLPQLVAQRVAPEPGTVVIVESTGPVTGRAGVRIGTDADGAPTAHELFSGHAEEEDEDVSVADIPEEAVTAITLSTHELTRRAAGRQSTEDTAYHVHGDEDLARRVLDALVVTP